MSEYIKTDDIVKSINVLLDNVDVSEDAMHKFCDSMNDIQKVEIVRCENCKYWDNTTKWAVCTKWSADPYEQANTEKNDFCSYGERADT